ncbi:MAG: SDR family oxidoreductase [Mangrovicoccus sp.]
MSGDLKTALITGAAEGIGWQTAQIFAARGYQVIIADLSHQASAARASELGPSELGTAHLGLGCDVTCEDQVAETVQSIMRHYGRLDLVVNNAGIGDSSAPSLEQSGSHFRKVIDVHLTGAFLVSRAAAAVMIDAGRGGAIVNISSLAGLTGLPRRNAYGAAKAGIIAMTRSMACEWGEYGIRVNAVAPGYIRTALVEKLITEGLIDPEALISRTPLGRLLEPSEISEAIYFLASPAASAITGTVLSVDGGWTAFGAAGTCSGAPNEGANS